jgi:hypothetical protein
MVVSVSLLVFFLLFVSVTQILGVPLWWIVSFLKPFSVFPPPPKLQVAVSPETPRNVGEMITVTVTNSSSRLPVEDVEVSVMKDGMNITLHTDTNGQAFFEYFGEVTVIVAQKAGIEPSTPVSIPKLPDAWVRNTVVSFASGIVGGFIGGVIPYLLQRKKTRVRRK